jgi:hypothetical protein
MSLYILKKLSLELSIQILKGKLKRNEGEVWVQPSGRKVTKKNGKIIPVNDNVLPRKQIENNEPMSWNTVMDTIHRTINDIQKNTGIEIHKNYSMSSNSVYLSTDGAIGKIRVSDHPNVAHDGGIPEVNIIYAPNGKKPEFTGMSSYTREHIKILKERTVYFKNSDQLNKLLKNAFPEEEIKRKLEYQSIVSNIINNNTDKISNSIDKALEKIESKTLTIPEIHKIIRDRDREITIKRMGRKMKPFVFHKHSFNPLDSPRFVANAFNEDLEDIAGKIKYNKNQFNEKYDKLGSLVFNYYKETFPESYDEFVQELPP